MLPQVIHHRSEWRPISRVFDEIRQLGYVVPDIEAYEPHNSVAFANSGFIQVELIQCCNDVPSMYRDFTRAGRTGLQHVASWTTNDDADLEGLIKHGFKPVMSGEVGINGRFIYFDTEYHPGTVIELSEVLGPKGGMFRLIREASKTWDGKIDPVRPFLNLSGQ